MRVWRFVPAAFLAWGLAAAAAAQDRVSTSKYEWRPINGIQEVRVRTGDIVINQVQFDLGSTMKGLPLRKSSAKVKVRIDNNGQTDEQVGVAVVVFDAEGNILAAGSNGTKWGYLNKGDRTYYSIDFPYVYRRLDEAASFLVTLETQGKPGKKGKPTAAEEPPEESKAVESEPLPTPVP